MFCYCSILLTGHSCSRYFYLLSFFSIYLKFYNNFATINADNEMFCTFLLTSQVVMTQSLQPTGREFESMCVVFLPLFDSFNLL